MQELYTFISHDFVKNETTVEYLTEDRLGSPYIIYETRSAQMNLRLATGEEIAAFWLKHRAQFKNKTEVAMMMFLAKELN